MIHVLEKRHMSAHLQVIPATPDELAEILKLEQDCFFRPWNERRVRTFLVAACLSNKGYLARTLKDGDSPVGYAFASRQGGQLEVERLGVQPDNRRKGIALGLMVSLI